MRSFLFLILLLFPFDTYCQINDCSGAEVICSSESFDFNPSGGGEDDLNELTKGCLEDEENSSAWYYFEINSFAPLNTSFAFLIIPDNGNDQDYDFALYGPNTTCNNLGAPLRCSYAANSPSTGLSVFAMDFTEDETGDGYVAPIVVNPGDGFFLLIDNYEEDGVGFVMEWAGNGADYLNCDATPPCEIEIDITYADVCRFTNFVDYDVELTSASMDFDILWTSPTGDEAWISDPTELEPLIVIPDGFVGNASFSITIDFNEINCVEEESFSIEIFDFPLIEGIEDELIYCSNDMITVGPSNSFSSVTDISWTQDGQFLQNDVLVETDEPGTYIISVSENGCASLDTLIIEKIGEPIDGLLLADSTDICEGFEKGVIFIEEIDGGTSPFTFELSSGEISDDLFFENLAAGTYTVLVTDVDGCTSEASVTLDAYLDTKLDLGNDTILDLGSFLEKFNHLNLSSSDIIFTEWLYNGLPLGNDLYEINFKPSDDGVLFFQVTDINGCSFSDSIRVRLILEKQIYIANTFTPNDDGVNDVFFIQGGPSVKKINFLNIYSRWGELVFESKEGPINEPIVGWDGTFKNKKLNSASFQYYCEVELIDGSIVNLHGGVTIVN